MSWAEKSALRWDCAKRGCHNINGRPKLLALADALPGRIAFGDVDATVEVGGHFLFIEWKSPGAPFGFAQARYHRALTALSPRIISILVEGYPASMECAQLQVIRRGTIGPWEPCSLQSLKARIARWASLAQGRRAAA